ncbi:hypothetical protein MKZ42_07645 [Pseudoalteromonas shioyasakiensis]|uniref:Uncharacterized protein n=1 Tax=Pseudoalteromonas shioyasakiensis TaxID=1190813 RepID=A0ABT6TUP9_9GAMM|nr:MULTISPECIES: hypothetical protein [Pseudoalteromonas]MDI4667634.1 hypothetical protein [Pseudoalteromonas shioyasakiensis]MDI4673136.1 hypothetical protein [Pseudoalteromonas shioyasakiensis]MDI4685200.1 hypothetical protein [Pseudoalteromonas shioyasakiensis]MDI4705073.1 hypothetical protein [Pseudoalteromonas shioyasakiensis]NUJ20537.1 hypothetical protein [Pseudoalteromonas sp. 0802]
MHLNEITTNAHEITNNFISEQIQITGSKKKALKILEEEQKDFLKWMRNKYFENPSIPKTTLPNSDELKRVVKESNRMTEANKEKIEDLEDSDFYGMLPQLLTNLGLHDIANEVLFRQLKQEIKPLLTVKIEKLQGEVQKEEAVKDKARKNGRSGGRIKAEKNQGIVNCALNEYVSNYSTSNLSRSHIAKIIKNKVNNFIKSRADLRSVVPEFSEESEAILKWISNYSHFIKNNEWKPKTPQAVKNFYYSQQLKKSEPSC